VVAVIAAMAACSSKGGSDSGAGGSGGESGSGGGGGGSGGMDASAACDPAAQNCSSAASKCDFHCDGTVAGLGCVAGTDGGALGSACSAAMPCPRGTGCLSAGDAGVVCRKYCAGDGDCATGERCHNVTVSISCSGASSPIALHYCF
jgi:hypothetical protein